MIALPVAAIAALEGGAADAVVTLLTFGGVNVAFYLGWHAWGKRRRPLSFGDFWATIVVLGAAIVGAIVAVFSGARQAAVLLGPVIVLVTLWGVLRLRLGARDR